MQSIAQRWRRYSILANVVTNHTAAATLSLLPGACASVAGLNWTAGVNSTADVLIDYDRPMGIVSCSLPLVATTFFKQPRSVQATNQSPFACRVAFTKPLAAFDASHISLTNGNISGLQQTSPITYTFQVYPATRGSVIVQVAANSTTDAAGNLNNATNGIVVLYDASGPQVELTTSAGAASVDLSYAVLVKFSKPVLNFTARSLNVTNGVVTWLFPLFPFGCFYQARCRLALADRLCHVSVEADAYGDVIVSVPAGSVVDGIGAPNVASNTLTIEHSLVITGPMAGVDTLARARVPAVVRINRMAFHLQVFALTEHLAVRHLPIFYRQVTKRLRWLYFYVPMPAEKEIFKELHPYSGALNQSSPTAGPYSTSSPPPPPPPLLSSPPPPLPPPPTAATSASPSQRTSASAASATSQQGQGHWVRSEPSSRAKPGPGSGASKPGGSPQASPKPAAQGAHHRNLLELHEQWPAGAAGLHEEDRWRRQRHARALAESASGGTYSVEELPMLSVEEYNYEQVWGASFVTNYPYLQRNYHGFREFWDIMVWSVGVLLAASLLLLLVQSAWRVVRKQYLYGLMDAPRLQFFVLALTVSGVSYASALLIAGSTRGGHLVGLVTGVVVLYLWPFLFILSGIAIVWYIVIQEQHARFFVREMTEKRSSRAVPAFARNFWACLQQKRLKGHWVTITPAHRHVLPRFGIFFEDFTGGEARDRQEGGSGSLGAPEGHWNERMGVGIVMAVWQGYGNRPVQSVLLLILTGSQFLYLFVFQPFTERGLQIAEAFSLLCESLLFVFALLVSTNDAWSRGARESAAYIMIVLAFASFGGQLLNHWVALGSQLQKLINPMDEEQEGSESEYDEEINDDISTDEEYQQQR
eukprot:jgi/Mesen1/11002/ME000097S10571